MTNDRAKPPSERALLLLGETPPETKVAKVSVENRCHEAAGIPAIGARERAQTRMARGFRAIAYPIAKRSAASYYPETNVLVSVSSVAPECNQPAYKSVRITLRASTAPLPAAVPG